MSINLRDASKFDKELPHQIEAWNWLQAQIPSDVLESFAVKYRQTETPSVNNAKTSASDLQTAKPNPLPVIYMSQRDNYRDASRTCFSSSCAMMLKFLKPNSIKNDDDYIRTVFTFGDSTDSNAQIKALKHYGVTAKFSTTGNRTLIKKQIDAGKPVPAGFLHHGSVQDPQGGGHYICIIGYDVNGYWVHDPWGQCDLINGTYPSTDGKKLHYSYKNFEPRWLVEGQNSGWCIVA
jgi:uncharacterized protein YvpB